MVLAMTGLAGALGVVVVAWWVIGWLAEKVRIRIVLTTARQLGLTPEGTARAVDAVRRRPALSKD
jgi:hypothetical protein